MFAERTWYCSRVRELITTAGERALTPTEVDNFVTALREETPRIPS